MNGALRDELARERLHLGDELVEAPFRPCQEQVLEILRVRATPACEQRPAKERAVSTEAPLSTSAQPCDPLAYLHRSRAEAAWSAACPVAPG